MNLRQQQLKLQLLGTTVFSEYSARIIIIIVPIGIEILGYSSSIVYKNSIPRSH